MKKNIIILLLLFTAGAHLSGQQNYYWSGGKKQFLTEVKNKFVVKLSSSVSSYQTRSALQGNSKIHSTDRLENYTEVVNSEALSLHEIRKLSGVIDILPAYSINKELLYVTGEILLAPKKGIEINQIIALTENNVKIIHKSKYNTFVLDVNDWSKLFEYANRIYESGKVEYCHPNFSFPLRKTQTQTDPLYPQQYYLNNTGQFGGTNNVDINAPEAWNITTGNTSVRVAVIDDGVEAHEDMAGRLLPGFTARSSAENPNRNGAPNNTNPPSTPYPNDNDSPIGHGQACAGIIAANHNGMGIRGIAPQVRIIPINIFNDWFIDRIFNGYYWMDFVRYRETVQDIANAIDAAWDTHAADVLSNSWGSSTTPNNADAIVAAINRARTQGRNGRGCPVIFASGNAWGLQGVTDVAFPSNVEGVITVGAIDNRGNIWNYSQRGVSMDLVAPSGNVNLFGNIRTTDRMGNLGYNNTNYMANFGGTSAACPQVSGVAALMLSVRPDLTETQVRTTLQNTARDLGSAGFDNTYGYGLVDAHAAVYAVAPHLSGPTSVCNQATYTIKNLPQGATVQWSASNNSMTLQSGQGTATALFRQTGFTNAEIRAAVRFNGATIANLAQAITVCQPFLSGPSAICNQATYTVENLPAGLQVQWQVHPGLHVYGQTNNSISVSKQSLTSPIEKGWVKATIVGTNITFRNDDILVWKSGTTQTNDLLVGQLDASGGQVEAVYPIQELGRNFQWSASNNWQAMIQGYHFTDFSGNPQSGASSVYITVRFDDPCGSETIIYKEFELPSTYSFSLSPNPVTDVTTLQWKLSGEAISMNSNSQVTQAVVWNRSTYEIQLWSGMTMLRSFRTNEPTFQIPMAGLPAELYFVRVIKDGQTYTQKLIKK